MTENPVSSLDRLSTTLNVTIEKSLFVIGFSMAALVAVQVFFRYVLNHSLFWSEELARFLLVWLTFLGASVAYHRRAHPGIDTFSLLLPACLKKKAVICAHLASLGLFSVMIVYGCQFAYFVRLQISPARLYSMDDALERLGRLIGSTPDWTTLVQFLPEGVGDDLLMRSAIASTFAASLELARQGKLQLNQSQTFAPIYVRARRDLPEDG